ncbi:YfgM family protein [Arenimonas sp.]|uniref:YfgM family protein n=1 Tax=Arenimonas sp. TaxID=1872635 RepID=UPI0039E4C765
MHQIDEYEQSERVRGWLRQNGSSLITGIALGLACVFGWQWWNGKGDRHLQEAATQYFSLDQALEAKDAGKVKTFGLVLRDKYADTAFADFAGLREAAFLHESGKTTEAIAMLQARKDKVHTPDLREIYALRLARLQLIAGKAKEAKATLAGIKTPTLGATVEELRGDIELALGQRDLARKAYEQALTDLDQAAPTRDLLQLKLIEAGGQPPAQPEI